jgi:TolB-like protein
MSFFNELNRRNVLRVAAAYLVVAWLIIQVAETIFPLFGFDDSPARIIVMVLAIGFIPAILFAWAFELTPDGLKKERDVDRSQSITPHTGQKLDRVVIVMLALALGYFSIDKFVLDPARDSALVEETAQQVRSDTLAESYGDKSIAVLPFADMSAEGDQEYFSDGLAEELLNLLAKVPELRVISRSSAFSFKDKELEITEIAKRLNVAHILEGSVRKAGNQIRITVQLIEARSDTHLWSETYDREFVDIFAIQDEISAIVVKQLKLSLIADTPRAKETEAKAYALYLQAKHLGGQVTPENLEAAVSLYKEAIALDPVYANAWIGLGGVYNRMVSLRLKSVEDGRSLSMEAAYRALEIAPNSAEAHRLLAWGMFNSGYGLKQIAHHYQLALQLEPTNIAVIGDVSLFISKLNRLDDSVRLAEYQVSRDPVSLIAHNNLGMRYRYSGQLAKAEKAFLTALTLNPTAGGIYYELGVTRLQGKDYSGAADAFSKEPILVFQNVGMVMAHHALGENSVSVELLKELISKYGERITYYIAQILSFRGEIDQAFDWLEKTRLADDRELLNAISEPLLANLQGDDRWAAFLEKTGQSPQQLALIEFDVELPE